MKDDSTVDLVIRGLKRVIDKHVTAKERDAIDRVANHIESVQPGGASYTHEVATWPIVTAEIQKRLSVILDVARRVKERYDAPFDIEVEIQGWVEECVQLAYDKTPYDFFGCYYKGDGEPNDHGVVHALDDLCFALRIMKDANKDEGDRYIKSLELEDYRCLVFAVLLHDISNALLRKVHAVTSAYYAGLLMNGFRFTDTEAVRIMRIANAHEAHEVKLFFGSQVYDQDYLAKVMKDADTLDNALNLERIFGLHAPDLRFFDCGISAETRQDDLTKKPGGAFKDKGIKKDRFQYLLACGINHRIPTYFKTSGARNVLFTHRGATGTGTPIVSVVGELMGFFNRKDGHLVTNVDGPNKNFSPTERARYEQVVLALYDSILLKRMCQDYGVDHEELLAILPDLNRRVAVVCGIMEAVVADAQKESPPNQPCVSDICPAMLRQRLTVYSPDVLEEIRLEIKRGDEATQDHLNTVCEVIEKHKAKLVGDTSDELFAIVRRDKAISGLTAPRWLCHLLGLRHRCAHVALSWLSPELGKTFILQVRSWSKADSPGHIDISVGGHVKGSGSTEETAYKEMEEEFGIARGDLKDGRLYSVGVYESYNERKQQNFHNAEWREVFVGELATENLGKIRFKDSEVVGLHLCPASQARDLLDQKKLPIASALALSLPRCF